jgi:hypothetical protein
MWSKVYLVRNENNEEIGVALMDTQVNIDDQKFSGYLPQRRSGHPQRKIDTKFFFQNI